MRAALFKGKGSIEIGERRDPVIQEPTDAVVRVVLACVCGSDLWYYRGESPFTVGDPIGHEFIGVVEAVGSKVTQVAEGDFVISPFAFSDNTCPNCQAGVHTACLHGGFMPASNGDGGQGERVRVIQANGSLVKVPGSRFSDETLASLLTLTDVMGTGYHAAVMAQVKPDTTVAVVGDGAVGLCAIIGAKMLGAERIIALSRNPARQELAREFGATDIVAERGEVAIEAVKQLTDGIGVDAALECVGTDQAMQTAFGIARAGSIVGTVGVPHGVNVPFEKIFYRNVGVHGGPAPVRAYLPQLLEAVLRGNINPGRVFDFTTTLDNVAEAYAAMDERRAIKSLLKVSEL
jgi:threonine dehydrogenase-like Zn-dependent dehydrogenase